MNRSNRKNKLSKRSTHETPRRPRTKKTKPERKDFLTRPIVMHVTRNGLLSIGASTAQQETTLQDIVDAARGKPISDGASSLPIFSTETIAQAEAIQTRFCSFVTVGWKYEPGYIINGWPVEPDVADIWAFAEKFEAFYVELVP